LAISSGECTSGKLVSPVSPCEGRREWEKDGSGTGEATAEGGARLDKKLSCRMLLTIVPLPLLRVFSGEEVFCEIGETTELVGSGLGGAVDSAC